MRSINFVLVLTNEDKKNRAVAICCRPNENLKGYGADPKVSVMHYCPTRKEARELADYWNQCYKENGSYDYPF